ncbi:MAG: TolC family protein [Chlamydiae bacterium]|nr:TolC family protein [Chlamydiota bacterium]
MYRFFVIIPLLFLVGCVHQKSSYAEVEKIQNRYVEKWQAQEKAEDRKHFFLKEALDIAFIYNKKLQAQLQQTDVAQGKEWEALSQLVPNIYGITAYTHLDKQPMVGSEANRVPVGSKDNYSLLLEARQPIFHGGALIANYNSTKYYSYMTKEQIRGQMQRLTFDVTKAYLDIILSEKLFLVNSGALQVAERHLKEVQLKKEQGLASSFDIIRAEVDVSNFAAEKIKQQNRINLAKTYFLKQLGIIQDNVFEVEDVLQYVELKTSVDEQIRKAYLKRPDLMAKIFDAKMQKESVNMAKAEYYPKINATFDERWGRPDPHFTTLDQWGREWTGRISLEWPLFDYKKRKGRVLQQTAIYRQKNILVDDLKESIVLEIQQALYSLNDAEEFVKSQKMDMEKSKEGLKLVQVGYNEGVNSEVEVSDALISFTKSQSFYYQAVYQHIVAKLNLELASGEIIIDDVIKGVK